MQPGGVNRGVAGMSELFHSLKVYLNNKNRLQPIIGLGSVTECVKAGKHSKEALYLCEVCVCCLSKADIRNHIMGSLHRYNYIKAWHPHFVAEWKDNPDLSKLAWPLMEMSKLLEKREGPGDVQVLEFEEAVYQKMASLNEAEAVTLLTSCRRRQGQSKTVSQSETTSDQPESGIFPSQRVVLLPQRHQGQSKKKADQVVKLKSPVQQNKNSLESAEPSVQQENGDSFLDGYTGTKTLIGLKHVVECRSEEDGHPYCFLCHCCRIKTIKDDLIDHLTSSSHVFNYLMEIHPEQVEVKKMGIHGNGQLLESVAKKVEQEEGRGQFKVMRVPASLGILLTGNSYHWCMKRLFNGNCNANDSTSTTIQKKKMVKGPSVGTIKASNQGVPHKRTAVQSKQANDSKKKMKMKKKVDSVTNTVFKVSLPLTTGSMLLERTSFSLDKLPVSPIASPALSPSPEPQTGDSDLRQLVVNQDEDTNLQSQFDFCTGDMDKPTNGQYPGQEENFKVTLYQKMCGYVSESQCFNQPENITGATSYEQRIFDNQQPAYETGHLPAHASFNQHHIQRGLIKTFDEDWKNEGQYNEGEELTANVYHTQDQSTYSSYLRREEGYTQEQWYGSDLQNKVALKVDVPREGQREIGSATNHRQYYQPQQQYLAQDYKHFPTDSLGLRAPTGEMASHLDVDRSNMDPNLNSSSDYSGAITAEPRPQFLEMEQRGPQTLEYFQSSNGYVQTAPNTNMMQPMVLPPYQGGHRVTPDPYYNTGPWTNPDLALPQPNMHAAGHRSQPHVFILPEQSQGYERHSDLYLRGVGNSSSDMMVTEIRWVPSPYINTYPGPSPDAAPQWSRTSVQNPVGSSYSQMIQHFF